MMLSMTASAIMVHPDVLATEWVSRVVTLAAVEAARLQYVAGNRPRKPNTKLPRNAGGQPSWPSTRCRNTPFAHSRSTARQCGPGSDRNHRTV